MMQWAERGGFAVAFFILAWWVSKRVDRAEDRANSKIDNLECYIRTELAALTSRCATALENVYDFIKGKP